MKISYFMLPALLLLLIALPYLIFKGVVWTTERDRAEIMVIKTSGLVAERFWPAVLKCGVLFVLASPLTLLATNVYFADGDMLHVLAELRTPASLDAFAIAVAVSFPGGIFFGMIQSLCSTGRSTPWIVRLLLGGICGEMGLLATAMLADSVFAYRPIYSSPEGLPILITLCGAICALLVHGAIYRYLFLRPATAT